MSERPLLATWVHTMLEEEENQLSGLKGHFIILCM